MTEEQLKKIREKQTLQADLGLVKGKAFDLEKEKDTLTSKKTEYDSNIKNQDDSRGAYMEAVRRISRKPENAGKPSSAYKDQLMADPAYKKYAESYDAQQKLLKEGYLKGQERSKGIEGELVTTGIQTTKSQEALDKYTTDQAALSANEMPAQDLSVQSSPLQAITQPQTPYNTEGIKAVQGMSTAPSPMDKPVISSVASQPQAAIQIPGVTPTSAKKKLNIFNPFGG